MSGMEQARVAPSVAGGWWEGEAFRVFAAGAPVGVMVVDPSGRLVYVNERWLEISGLAAREARGLEWLRRIHPADRRMVMAAARRVVSSVGPVGVECRVRRSTGETLWVRGRCTLVRSSGGLLGYAVWVEDVTAERDARAKAERLSLVLERSTDFVTIIDLSGRLLYANETVRRFFGVETGADVGRLPKGLGFTEASQRRLDEEDRQVSPRATTTRAANHGSSAAAHRSW